MKCLPSRVPKAELLRTHAAQLMATRPGDAAIAAKVCVCARLPPRERFATSGRIARCLPFSSSSIALLLPTVGREPQVWAQSHCVNNPISTTAQLHPFVARRLLAYAHASFFVRGGCSVLAGHAAKHVPLCRSHGAFNPAGARCPCDQAHAAQTARRQRSGVGVGARVGVGVGVGARVRVGVGVGVLVWHAAFSPSPQYVSHPAE
jgi:hypothetical protein